MKRKQYVNKALYKKIVMSVKLINNRYLLAEASFIYYNDNSDPSLNKDTQKAYNKYIRSLNKDKSIMQIHEDIVYY